MNWTNEIWHQFQNFSAFFRIFQALLMRISRHFIIFWEYPWNSDKIPSKFRRKMTKFIVQSRNEMKFHFISFRPKSLTVFCWNFEVLAVRRQRNLLELEKCFKKWAYSRYRSCRYRGERAPQSLRCFISLFQSYPYGTESPGPLVRPDAQQDELRWAAVFAWET